MNDINGMFGLIGIGCGIYCLYAYYLLKFKGKITSSVLLPKDVDERKCKDYRGYCKEAQAPVLMMGTVATLYGGVDLYCTYMGGSTILVVIMIVAIFVTLVIFSVWTRKINKKYFDM